MYLRTLSLAGFKSFADRTRLEFEAGVNVIVGPNGAGKSNLVDAVAWVLGTQAVTALRTTKMDEVIFSGTALRPPHSRAEVQLTFDNSDGGLPLDLAEVTIGRRLFRDGTSEYEINGTSCRLLDIQELLADGGVGRHQHVIVGQGRIGEILNARPEEHRAVIEEAAGVVKHRARRDRSIRRLEQTDVDLTRLADILHEQQRLMRPLRRQAKAAEQYDEVKARVRELRLWLSGAELRRIRERLGTADAERSEIRDRLAAAQAEHAGLEAAFPALESAAGAAGSALERDTAAAARLETVAERLARITMVARERRTAAEGRLRGSGDRRRDLEEEIELLTGARSEAAGAEPEARALLERREAALRALEEEERSLAEQAQMPAEGVVATLRGDLSALEAAADRDRRELEAVTRRADAVAARLEGDAAESDRMRAEIRGLDVAVAPAQRRFDGARREREREQEVLEAAESEMQEARYLLAGAAARVEALEAAVEGIGDPAGRELAAADEAVVGPLVAMLDVPPGLEAAVDAALGRWAGALAAADGEGVAAVIGRLKSAGYGGVPVVAASGSPRHAPARAVAEERGVTALVDLLGPGADDLLAAELLGDVLVIEGWTAARDLVRRHPGLRAVTPEGDLITATGISPALPDGAGPAALEAARASLESADTAVRRAASHHATARRQYERARNAEREALEALEAAETRLAGTTEALATIERSRAEHEAERDRLSQRRHALEEAAALRTERVAALRTRLAEFEGEEDARQRAWEEISRRRVEVAARRDTTRRAVQEAAADLAAVTERLRITTDRMQHVAADLAVVAERREDPAEPERLRRVEDRAAAALAAVRAHLEALRARQRELRAEAGSAGALLDESRLRRRDLERSIAALKERRGALDVETAELRVRAEAAAEAIRRDADATEEEALAAPRPEMGDDDPAGLLEAEAARLRRMGPINPLAAAEYAELAARAEFLEAQIADLQESRRELRKVITALDRQIGNQFHEAFAEIARLYEENFALLFPGGRGTLRLTEPDDPLETGVEIEAQPLGKKVKRLALLSGGERSLAALAFLFAVFRARPSPFYILDEVEAALDDANLRRFLRLTDTLRGTAQLAIVTHQQHTMEAADILYGVTMEPGESSQVVAKRLADVRR